MLPNGKLAIVAYPGRQSPYAATTANAWGLPTCSAQREREMPSRKPKRQHQ
jgi:hypothetical protein